MAHYRGAQPSPAARDSSAALPGYVEGANVRAVAERVNEDMWNLLGCH